MLFSCALVVFHLNHLQSPWLDIEASCLEWVLDVNNTFVLAYLCSTQILSFSHEPIFNHGTD